MENLYNILFITDNHINPYKSGIDRTTSILANAFIRQGYPCFLAYFKEQDAEGASDIMTDKIKLNTYFEAQLQIFIQKNNINIVIVNTAEKHAIKESLKILRKISENNRFPIGIAFCFHTFPFYELLKPDPSLCMNKLLHFKNLGTNVKKLIHYAALSLVPRISRKYIIAKNRVPYQYADKIVFLSEKYIPPHSAGLSVKMDNKFCAIPNSLTFDFILDPVDLSKKEKEVLIVARLDEESKKISKALEIWKRVEENGSFSDWKLIIVGAGPDEQYFKKLAAELILKTVFFEGRQKPLNYYQRTSLFMMTSAYEGLPMTLLEAQQMGTVPIAFNSFESLSDIIEDGYNGAIIPNHELTLFTEKLMWLMQHQEEREKMALNGLQSCRRFSIENVTHEWINLFESLARK